MQSAAISRLLRHVIIVTTHEMSVLRGLYLTKGIVWDIHGTVSPGIDQPLMDRWRVPVFSGGL